MGRCWRSCCDTPAISCKLLNKAFLTCSFCYDRVVSVEAQQLQSRSKARVPFRPILFGILVGVLLSVCGALFSAGGHNFALMRVFFPWAMLLSSSFTQLTWWLPFIVLVLVQFPVYFVLPGMVDRGRAGFWSTVGVLALVHTAGVILCFAADASESWHLLFR